MPTLTITKNYDDGSALTESQLDDIKTSIETWANTTKLDSDNIQTGGIATANYAALSVDAAALAANAVTTAKITDSNVTTAKIADLNVTTGKLAANAVTRAKIESVGQQISSSCGAFTTASTSYTSVTNLSVTITTTGRPVYVFLQDDASSNGSNVGINSAGTAFARFAIYRDATQLTSYTINATALSYVPSGCIMYLDTPSSGTYTYTLKALQSGGITAVVFYSKLVAFEL